MGGLDVINILDGLDQLFKKSSRTDGLDVTIILDGLDGCPSDGMDWMLDGLLTTLCPVHGLVKITGVGSLVSTK